MSRSLEVSMSELLLWETIEVAWTTTPCGAALRRALLSHGSVDAEEDLRPIVGALKVVLARLTHEGIVAFCREFERAVHALDREELAHHLGHGDDGFLDARTTIVLLGQTHFRDVQRDPRRALSSLCIESVPGALHLEWKRRFGERLPSFGFSVTTASNGDGWPHVRERVARDERVAAAVARVVRQFRIGAKDPPLPAGSYVTFAVPHLEPGELALVLRRLAALLEGKV